MADLIFGAKNGLLEKVKQQLGLGVDVNHCDSKDGATALYWAACSGHSSVVSILLEYAANVNQTVNWGSTALHAAADRGHTKCMKLLLEHNANPNIQNQNGDTPLHLAAFRGHERACLILLDFDVDLTIPNKGGKNAKQEAQAGQHFELAKMLEEKSKGRLPASYPRYQPNMKRQPSNGYSSSDQELKKYNIMPDKKRYGVSVGDVPTRTDPVFGDTRDIFPTISSRNQPVHKTFSAPPSPSEKSNLYKPKEGGSPGNYVYAMQLASQDAKGIIDDLQLKLAMAESEKDALKSKIEKVAEKRYFEDSSLSTASIEDSSIQRVKSELALTKQALCNLEQRNKQLENAISGQRASMQTPMNNLSGVTFDHARTPRNIASAIKHPDFGLQLIKAISEIGKMFNERDTSLFPIMSNTLADISSVTLQQNQKKLLDHLNNVKCNFKKWRTCRLDRPGQVWNMGHQYKLVQKSQFTKTVNYLLTRHISVAFEILHQDKKYIMKVMPIQPDIPNINFLGNGSKNSFNAVKNEREVLLNVPAHSNLVTVLHYFELPLRYLDPNLSNLRDQRATMALMPEYLMTLCKLMKVQNQNPSIAFALCETFFQQVLLQILKALSHLQDHDIAHRDIKPDCVYITESLQVVLGGFRMAMKLTEQNGQPIQFTNRSQIGAGNPLAWTPELKKWEKEGPPKTWERKIMLSQVYESSDIYNFGRLIFSLMKQEMHAPQSTPNMINPCLMSDWRVVPRGYSKTFTDLLQEMFAKESQNRPTVKEAILRTSMMLYGPKVDEVQSQQDCDVWVISQCSRLVSQTPDLRDKNCNNMATEELAHAVDWELRTDYLTEVSGNELWQLICSLQNRSGHRKEINT
ncbi:uncharacterized protein [Antedon mediterranea]|uniref:uncharacterized protein n=1 Tax=Antedon mediterranea TaxID=105859 RepID=UPI003AF6287A